MKVLVVTIGDEILIGQTIDTNSAWLAKELHSIGVGIDEILSIHDTEDDILNVLEYGVRKFDLVLVTGGLGPTKDDLTKDVFAKFLGVNLVFHQEISDVVKAHFKALSYKMPESNMGQAYLPEGCRYFINNHGTAPGMWFEKDKTVFISMPGVPYEMKGLMQDGILDAIKTHFNRPKIVHETILTQGIGESALMEIISEWEDALKNAGLSLAYLPSPGLVKLRISGSEANVHGVQEKVEYFKEKLRNLIPQYIFGYNEDTIEMVLGGILREHGKTLATAESCTGGRIASMLTSVPGASGYFKGSIVAYSNHVKTKFLQVPEQDLQDFGAVSKPVAEQMAVGALNAFDTDFAIASTGIAGPDGGTLHKEVGTVWIALASKDRVVSKRFLFGNQRERNIHKSALMALNMLRKEILNKSLNILD